MHDHTRRNFRRLRRPRPRAGQGFSLLETTLAVLLLSLILAGVMDLFLTTATVTNKSNALAFVSGNGANAVQQVLKDTREAQSLCLPDDSFGASNGFQPLAAYASLNSYETTVNGNKVVTALQINRPAPRTASFFLATGASKSIPAPDTLYDRGTTGTSHLLYYRGDASQAPNPTTGKYLWKYDSAANTTVAVCRTVATGAADSVQFLQPSGISTQVAVKIVSGEYSLINGQQTSEATDGSTTSALTGKCVLMRDYGAGSVASQDQGTCNHAFQNS